MNGLAQARDRLAEEWRSRSPETAGEIADFYRETENYPDDLNAWHETDARRAWSDIIVAAARATKPRTILDVGAGMGHDLFALKADSDAYLLGAIEPNDLMRSKLEQQGIPAWASIADTKARNIDLMICMDVLEHVPDPDALLLAMIDKLNPNGIIIEATATHDLATPLHLPALRGWSAGRILDRYGFVARERAADRVTIWQRVAERREDVPSLLLCAYRSLGAESAMSFMEMVKRGWRYQIHRGDALVSRVRSIAVSKWLRETDGDVFLMVDDDIVYTPEDAERVVALAKEKGGIACAAYPVRGGTHLACRAYQNDLRFGPDVPPIEIQYAGTGFMAATREVCEAIAATMPLCHADTDWAMWPMFAPFVVESSAPVDPPIHEYLSEDWAFCRRASELGFGVWLDPRVVLTHIGAAEYSIYSMRSAQFETTAPATEMMG